MIAGNASISHRRRTRVRRPSAAAGSDAAYDAWQRLALLCLPTCSRP